MLGGLLGRMQSGWLKAFFFGKLFRADCNVWIEFVNYWESCRV